MKKIVKLFLICICLFIGQRAYAESGSQKAFETKFSLLKKGIEKEEDGLKESDNMMVPVFGKSSYSIKKVRENGNTSEIDVVIKGVNLDPYAEQFMETIAPLSDPELDLGSDGNHFEKAGRKFFENIAKRKDLSYVETPMTVHLEKNEKQWNIVNGSELYGAILGGNSRIFN